MGTRQADAGSRARDVLGTAPQIPGPAMSITFATLTQNILRRFEKSCSPNSLSIFIQHLENLKFRCLILSGFFLLFLERLTEPFPGGDWNVLLSPPAT